MDKISKIGLAVSVLLLISLYAMQIKQGKVGKGAPPVKEEITQKVKEAVIEKKIEEEKAVEVNETETESVEKTMEGGLFPSGLTPMLIETELMSIELSSYGGVIKKVVLKENERNGIRRLQGESVGDVLLFDAGDVYMATGAVWSPEIAPVSMESVREGNKVKFSYYYSNKLYLFKEYFFKENSYIVNLRMTIKNDTEKVIKWKEDECLQFICGTIAPIEKRDDVLGVDILNQRGEVIRKTAPTEKSPEYIDWMGLKTKYFASIVKTVTPAVFYEVKGKLKGDGRITRASLGCMGGQGPSRYEYLTGILGIKSELKPKESVEYNFVIYMGPADYKILKGEGNNFEKILNLGSVLSPISKALIWLLDELYRIVGSYGWSIIIMTMLAKLVIWPLTHRSYKSMREMQKLQPQLSSLREKYKSDPKKIQSEMMKLYKEHGVSPWGGCLPMLLQMPVLFALFTTLRNTILLRKAPFWIIPGKWIMDLSSPDAFMTFEKPVKLLVFELNQLNILPLLMGVTFYLQQKYMPTAPSGNPQSEQQQKMMAVMMPAMFMIIFYSLPAGLNLYFFVSTITSVAGQMFAARKRKS